LTLHLEIEHIWFSRWNYTTIVFLALRYMPFVEIILGLHNQTFSDVPAEQCKVTYPAEIWLAAVQLNLADIALGIRTWAIWNRNKAVGIGLATVVTTGCIVPCVLANKLVRSLRYSSPPYSGFRGCFITSADRVLMGNYITLTVVEVIYLVLISISAFRAYRHGNTGKLLRIVHRDGILSYIFLLCVSIASVVVSIVLPLDMMLLLAPLLYLMYSVLTTRIVLNIRDVSGQGMQTELHTSYIETLSMVPMPIECMEHPQCASCDYTRSSIYETAALP